MSISPNDDGELLLALDRAKPGEAPTEQLRISIREFKGHRFVEARLFWMTPEGTWAPSKKGLSIRSRELSDVLGALEEAQVKINGRGAHRGNPPRNAGGRGTAPPDDDSPEANRDDW
jgi:hypothetical protein